MAKLLGRPSRQSAIWRTLTVAAACILVAGACASDSESTSGAASEDPSGEVRINELQYIGSHNSYKIQPTDELFEAEKAVVDDFGADLGDIGDINSLLYSHPSLTEQLASGIRSFELDVWADPEGGLFETPMAPLLLNVAPVPSAPEMSEPGFKVLHILDVDATSTCPTFVMCLTEIREFVDDNPSGVPIVILVELKDDPLPEPIDVTKPVPIDKAQMDALDAEIRSVFDEETLLTPDDVRGDADSLREAVESDGWPTLTEAGGTVMFLMDNAGDKRLDYIEGAPNLEGRVMFTTAGIGEDDGAAAKVNDPGDGSEIEKLVEAGIFVRTRSDADLIAPDSQHEAAFASGAQIVSTDFPAGNENHTLNEDGSTDLTNYIVQFERPLQVRCNPVSAAASCEI